MLLISAEAIIKQLPIPVFSHILRMVGKNLIVFFHNLLILPIVCLCVQKGITWNILYFRTWARHSHFKSFVDVPSVSCYMHTL